MEGEIEFQKLGVEFADMRSIVTEDGSNGVVILTDGATIIVEHNAERAAAITTYLRIRGIPVYGYDDNIPDDDAPITSDVSIQPL
jgi:hypothetical protein